MILGNVLAKLGHALSPRRMFGDDRRKIEKFSGQLAINEPERLPRNAPRGRQFVFSDTMDRIHLDRTSLTLQRISTALRDAERGWTETQSELFEGRIEADAHLRSDLDNRNESVSLKPWTLLEGADDNESKRAAAELEKRLRLVPALSDAFSHQLQFVPFGWAASETNWDIVDGMVAPTFFKNVPHRRFLFEQQTDDLRLRVFEDTGQGVALRPGKWWITCRARGRLVSTAGLMRTLVWWSTFKTMSLRDWMVLSDRFGIPYVTGEYDENIADEDKEVLRQAVADLGSDGFAIFSNMAKIAIHEIKHGVTGNSAQGIHGALITLCDLQVSKLVQGASLVSQVQGPGSHALGSVHENRYHDILEGDAQKLSESFQTTIGKQFLQFNGIKAAPPGLKVHLRLNMSVKDQLGLALDLANRLDGFELDERQIRSMTLLRAPQPGTVGLRGLDVVKAIAEAAQQSAAPPEE